MKSYDEMNRLEDLLNALAEGRPAWHAQANCLGRGAEMFFPERGESHLAARRMCETCPVAAECWEVGRHERDGIWAGTTGRQRRRAKREAYLAKVADWNAEATCVNGHPKTAADTVFKADGRIACRACINESSKRYRSKKAS